MTSKDYERDMDDLQCRLDEGSITQAQYNKEAKEIERWYRDAQLDEAEQAARDAYDRVMERR